MDVTKIVIAALGSGPVGLAAYLLFRIIWRALDPAVIREFSRRRVVKQIQKSAGGRFTPTQLKTLRALLEPVPPEAGRKPKKPSPPEEP